MDHSLTSCPDLAHIGRAPAVTRDRSPADADAHGRLDFNRGGQLRLRGGVALPSGSLHDVDSEQCLEGLGQFSSDTVFVDVDLVEEGLIEQSPGLGVGVEVGTLAVTGEVERSFQVGFDGVEMRLGGRKPGLDGLQLGRDAVLLRLHQVEGDSSGVVGLQEFGAFVHQPLSLGGQLSLFGFGLCPGGGEVIDQHCFDVLAQFGCQLDNRVVILDQLFDDGDE